MLETQNAVLAASVGTMTVTAVVVLRLGPVARIVLAPSREGNCRNGTKEFVPADSVRKLPIDPLRTWIVLVRLSCGFPHTTSRIGVAVVSALAVGAVVVDTAAAAAGCWVGCFLLSTSLCS